jgi:hypothetical protein
MFGIAIFFAIVLLTFALFVVAFHFALLGDEDLPFQDVDLNHWTSTPEFESTPTNLEPTPQEVVEAFAGIDNPPTRHVVVVPSPEPAEESLVVKLQRQTAQHPQGEWKRWNRLDG